MLHVIPELCSRIRYVPLAFGYFYFEMNDGILSYISRGSLKTNLDTVQYLKSTVFKKIYILFFTYSILFYAGEFNK